MRGKGQLLNHFLTDYRITPAYAGKSKSSCPLMQMLLDHPRLCGEKFLIPRIAASQLGSPPPMRGKDFGFSVVEI